MIFTCLVFLFSQTLTALTIQSVLKNIHCVQSACEGKIPILVEDEATKAYGGVEV
jgi:hypothetical protein